MFVTTEERRMIIRVLLLLSIALFIGALVAASTQAQAIPTDNPVIATEAPAVITEAPVTVEPTDAPDAPPATDTPPAGASIAVEVVNALYDRLSATSVTLALAAVFGIVAVALVALRLVYNSVPAGIRGRVEDELLQAAREVLAKADRHADTTPTQIDDALIAKLRELLDKAIDERLKGG